MTVTFDERESKMLADCIRYMDDPYGAPNHLLMVLVAKLYRAWKVCESTHELITCSDCGRTYEMYKNHVCMGGGTY
jgi:hypothetical protein